ncbi:MOFRL family protein [Planctomycetota bacterium]
MHELTSASIHRDFAILSGGTDGEDGPTDCSGAFCNLDVLRRAQQIGIDAREYLARNDAHGFFEQIGGLFKTGPTKTNVCDIRVITISC